MEKFAFDTITKYCPQLGLSWSSISGCLPEFGGCPRKFWFSKFPDTKKLEVRGEQLDLGNAVHEFAEDYMLQVREKGDNEEWYKAEYTGLVREYKLNEACAKDLEFMNRNFMRNKPFPMEGNIIVESSLALDSSFNPCEWFVKNNVVPLVRGKIDLYYFIELNEQGQPLAIKMVDWKSGRLKEPQMVQLQLYALLLRQHFPTLERFEVSLYFVRENKWINKTLGIADCEAAQKWVTEKSAQIFATEFFKAEPNNNCKWCGWAKLCEAHKEIDTSTPGGALAAVMQATAFAKAHTADVKTAMKDTDDGRVHSDNSYAYMKQGPDQKVLHVFDFVKLIMEADMIDNELDGWKAAAHYLKLDTAHKDVKEMMDDPILSDMVDKLCTIKPGYKRFTIENNAHVTDLLAPAEVIPSKPDVIIEGSTTKLERQIIPPQEDPADSICPEITGTGKAACDQWKKEFDRRRVESGLHDTPSKNGFIYYVLGGKYKTIRGCKIQDCKKLIYTLSVSTKEQCLEIAKQGKDGISSTSGSIEPMTPEQESGEVPAETDIY